MMVYFVISVDALLRAKNCKEIRQRRCPWSAASMCRSDQSTSDEPRGMRDRLERLFAGSGPARREGLGETGADFILGPDLAIAPEAEDPELSILRDDNVVAMRAGRRLGDPLADYIDLWFALERFHERASLTEDGWRCLTEDLQRPLELRLAERRPVTVEGALKALELARYLMENLDSSDNGGSGDWYRRLRNHLVESAHVALQGGLLQRKLNDRQEKSDHAKQ
jgi:hypothetical protein